MKVITEGTETLQEAFEMFWKDDLGFMAEIDHATDAIDFCL